MRPEAIQARAYQKKPIWTMVQYQKRPRPNLNTQLPPTHLNQILKAMIKNWLPKNPNQKTQSQFQSPNPSHQMEILQRQQVLHWRKLPKWTPLQSPQNPKCRPVLFPKCLMSPPRGMAQMGKQFMGSCTATQNLRSALSASAMEAHSHQLNLCSMLEALMYLSLWDT